MNQETDLLNRAWLYARRYEKFIRVTGGGKFYRAIMHRTHPQRADRFARRRCKSASQAQHYGGELAIRYLRWLLSAEIAKVAGHE